MHNHTHDHLHHTHGKQDLSRSNLRLAFVLNFSFTIIEIIGGFLTNSMAILSDALHDFGDTLGIGLSWYFQRVSGKTRDRRFSYGYRRVSLLSALINAVILLTGSLFIIYETIPRLLDPQPVHSTGMLLLAILGVLVNGAAVLRLRSGKSSNERVVRLHLLEDVLGWIAVLFGSIAIKVGGWLIIDPLLSLLIASYIFYNAIKNFRDFIRIFLQGVPQGIDIEQVAERLSALPDVNSIHDIHIWSMDGEYNVLSAHIVVDDETGAREQVAIKEQVRKIMHEFDIEHETLEFEFEFERCAFTDC